MSDLFDAARERAARDAGAALAAANRHEWMDRALGGVMLRRGSGVWTFDGFTGEDVRASLLAGGLEKPSSPNAWGALMLTLVRRRLVTATGEHRAMQAKGSHARKTPVYRWSA